MKNIYRKYLPPAGMEELAQKDGLIGNLYIYVMSPGRDEGGIAFMCLDYDTDGQFGMVVVDELHWEGLIRHSDPIHRRLQFASFVLAHEIKHLIDARAMPRWKYKLLGLWGQLISRLSRYPISKPVVKGRMFGWLYNLCPLERRANAYAESRSHDYYEILKEYNGLT